jgi:hypothetical protein
MRRIKKQRFLDRNKKGRSVANIATVSRWTSNLNKDTVQFNIIHITSVPDPDPEDPEVFGRPGPDPSIIKQK